MSRSVDVHAVPPGAELAAGSDLLVEMPPGLGLSLADGVLIDDHLDRAARARIDELAMDALAAWHSEFDALFRIDGLPVADALHSELMAQVFLPVVRIAWGLRRALSDLSGAGAVRLRRLDPGFAPVLAEALPGMTFEAIEAAPPAPPPPRAAIDAPAWLEAARSLPLPVGPRRGAFVSPYHSTLAVLERLVATRAPRVMVDLEQPPPRALALSALRGGAWMGRPGRRARARALVGLGAAFADARGSRWELDVDGLALGPLLARRSLELVEREGAAPLLRGLAIGRAAESGRLAAVLMAFDQGPDERMTVRAAQAAGVPVLVVHHGYMPGSTFLEGELADHVGVWTELELPRFAGGRARVVGNPGLGSAPEGVARDPRTAVVLTQNVYRVSAKLDGRTAARHIAAAVAALRAADPDLRVVLRPHPADSRSEYERLTAETGADAVDMTTPARELLASAAVCVGATSTAALETAVVGTPLVMLDVEDGGFAPPFDGSGDVLYTRSADEAAEAIGHVLGSRELPGRASLLDALGASVPDPVARVAGWVRELA